MTAPANTAELKRLADLAAPELTNGIAKAKVLAKILAAGWSQQVPRSKSAPTYADAAYIVAICKAGPDLISTIERLAEEIPSWRSMDDAPKDCIIIAMCRYPSATAGSPSFVSWDGEFGWEYGRNKPEKMVCWAWMPREILGDWPSETLSHAKTKEGK